MKPRRARVNVPSQSLMLSLVGSSVVQEEKTESISWLFAPKWLRGLCWQAPAELLSAVAAGGQDSVAHFENAAAAGSADLLAVHTSSSRADRVTVHVRCSAEEGGWWWHVWQFWWHLKAQWSANFIEEDAIFTSQTTNESIPLLLSPPCLINKII